VTFTSSTSASPRILSREQRRRPRSESSGHCTADDHIGTERDEGDKDYDTSTLTVTLIATDPDDTAATSTTTDTLDGGTPTTHSLPFTVSGDGSHTITFFSTDKAGNVEKSQTLPLLIDTTAPTGMVGKPDRSANANNWYNAPVTVTFAGTDATSGIASCTTGSYSDPDSISASVNGSCTDNTGNVGNGSTRVGRARADEMIGEAIVKAAPGPPYSPRWLSLPGGRRRPD